MKSREDNQIKAESVVGLSALGRFLTDNAREAQESGEAVSITTAEDAVEASRAALLPPYNAKAKTAAGVYRAREIISEDEWDALSEQVEEMLAQCEGSDDGAAAFRDQLFSGHKYWPAHVKELLQRTGLPSDPDSRERVICLLYLRHLMDFNRGPYTYKYKEAVSGLAGNLRVPEIVASRFLQSFAVAETPRSGQQAGALERYQRTKALRDKLVLHIIVMYLIVEGFSVSASKVATDLSMADSGVSPLFRQVGCMVSKKYKTPSGRDGDEEAEVKGKSGSKMELIAQLTVPLKFPAVKKGPRMQR